MLLGSQKLSQELRRAMVISDVYAGNEKSTVAVMSRFN